VKNSLSKDEKKTANTSARDLQARINDLQTLPKNTRIVRDSKDDK
jgi:hypothetical protein